MKCGAKRHRYGLLRALVIVCVILSCSFDAAAVYAQEAAEQTDLEQTNEDGTSEAEMEKEKMRPTLDLGMFKIKDLRPTRNETARVTFEMHLAFSKDVTEKQVERLEAWKHRLRDQVITAVRLTETKDFHEPDLRRFRREILIRVNRILKHSYAEDVLFTEYLFRLHE